jgi:site-specific recombinase XerD
MTTKKQAADRPARLVSAAIPYKEYSIYPLLGQYEGGKNMYTSANIKTSVINNIMLQMSEYMEKAMLDILQRVLEEQFVFLNVEQITTLPAEADTSTEEKNRYLIGLFKIKKRNLTPKTMEQYLRAVNSLITVIDKPVTEMDEIDIDYYLRWYQRRNVCNNGLQNQASTCNNERRYLSAFFTWLRKERFVPGNPVEAVEPLKETRKPIDYFRPAQLEELREGCRTFRDRAIVEVLRSTGARVGEVAQINAEDVDWKTGDILIRGEKGGRYRTIYLDEVARYHLHKYIASRTDNDKALFVGIRNPHGRLTVGGIRASLKLIAKRIGCEYRVYPHKMRKTLGMSLKNSGVDLGSIQEVLGHASPAVTSRYYAESTPDTLRSVRQRVAA